VTWLPYNIGGYHGCATDPGRGSLTGMTTASSTYALRLSDDELGRYRMMAARARAEEGDLWALAGLVPGARVADVGCGPGAMLVTLAEVVGPTGHVVGVDADPVAVAAARAALAAARLGGAVAPGGVRQGRAESTGLPPGSVDTAVLRHVLGHNGPAAQRIVDHLATLVRPGGHVYLVDADQTTVTRTAGPAEVLELQAQYVRWHELQGNDPRIGLRLPDLARAAGLDVVEYRGWTVGGPAPRGRRGPAWAARDELTRAGLADAADVARWDAAFTALDAASERPETSLGIFAAVCRRPA
jgi:SAM-dependent methyltransferase